MTMVSGDTALENVAFGDDGIIASLPEGGLHISASTISVEFSERLVAAHAAAGQQFLAAPVFGAPDAASAGTLHVVAGGKEEAVAAARPALKAVGQSIFVASESPPVANLAKLSGNFLFASIIESLGEAVALVAKAGVDRRQYLDFLTATLFNVPVYKSYGGRIVDDRFNSPAFKASLGQKDIRLVLAAAEALNVPMPIASLLRDRFLTLMARGGESLDWTAIGQLAARDAGEVSD